LGIFQAVAAMRFPRRGYFPIVALSSVPGRSCDLSQKPISKGKAPAKVRRAKSTAKAKPNAVKAKPAKASEGQATGKAASMLIDQRIRDLGDWRGEALARMRALILEADPEAVEEWKWMGTPVWSHQGIICTGESYTKVVKLTFSKGASLPDPKHLFNSSLEGNVRRAIDIPEGKTIEAAAFKALVKAAVARNQESGKKR
jgi:hypothetical protein